MPKLVTDAALLTCDHCTGVVVLMATQFLVLAEGGHVLVKGDPPFKPIGGCANIGPTIKPCTLTISVEEGYSDLVYIGGRSVCLDTLTGGTDGTPPGVTKYTVRAAGQSVVSVES